MTFCCPAALKNILDGALNNVLDNPLLSGGLPSQGGLHQLPGVPISGAGRLNIGGSLGVIVISGTVVLVLQLVILHDVQLKELCVGRLIIAYHIITGSGDGLQQLLQLIVLPHVQLQELCGGGLGQAGHIVAGGGDGLQQLLQLVWVPPQLLLHGFSAPAPVGGRLKRVSAF